MTSPTLLITADPDKGGIISPALAEEARAMKGNLQVAHIDGTGHHIRFEGYDRYVAEVRAFLDARVGAG